LNTSDIAIVIDTREQTPFQFENLISIRGSLQSGDYSIQGLEHLFAIERKSISDLIGSVTGGRERFERELHRLRGFHFKRLLIVGDRSDVESGNYRSKANPNSILNTLAAFEVRYDIPVVWGCDEKQSALLIEKWAYWFAREIDKNASWRG
jgi:ERCC4-type nuclease